MKPTWKAQWKAGNVSNEIVYDDPLTLLESMIASLYPFDGAREVTILEGAPSKGSDSKTLHVDMAVLLAETSRALVLACRSAGYDQPNKDLMDRIEDALNDATYGIYDSGSSGRGFHFEIPPEPTGKDADE